MSWNYIGLHDIIWLCQSTTESWILQKMTIFTIICPRLRRGSLMLLLIKKKRIFSFQDRNLGARHYFFFVCVRFWQSWKLGISWFGILQIIHTSLYNSKATHSTQEGNMQSYIISCVSVCAPMCFWIICVVLMCSLLVHCVHFNTHQYTYQYTYQKGIYDIHIYIYI